MDYSNARGIETLGGSETLKASKGALWGVIICPLIETPAVVNFRDGGASGEIKFAVRPPMGATTGLKGPPLVAMFPAAIIFDESIYVEYTVANVTITALIE